jgi:hypothetical protein
VLGLHELSPDRVDAAYAAVGAPEARELARLCSLRAKESVQEIRVRLDEVLQPGGAVDCAYTRRQDATGMREFLAGLPPLPESEATSRGLRSRMGRMIRRAIGAPKKRSA